MHIINIKNDRQHFRCRTRTTALYFLAWLFGISLMLMVFDSLYYRHVFLRQIYRNEHQTMALYNDQMMSALKNSLAWLLEFCSTNPDAALLALSNYEGDLYSHSLRVKESMELNALSVNIGGMFIYSEPHDIYIPQINNKEGQSSMRNTECAEFIRDTLRSDIEIFRLDDWSSLKVKDEVFMVRVVKHRGMYEGIWYNTRTIGDFSDYYNAMNAKILFVNRDGIPQGKTEFSDCCFPPEEYIDKYAVRDLGTEGKYFVTGAPFHLSEYCLITLIPMSSIDNIVSPVNFVTFLTIALLLGLSSVFFWQMRRLQESIYATELARKDLQLRYMKSQVAPHFLINCLNTVLVMSGDPDSRSIIPCFVSTLSRHLRYTLSTEDEVSLREELEYVENYLQLTQLRYPDSLSYFIDVPEELMDAKVFPLILLELTENSIKSNHIMHRNFRVMIHGSKYTRDGVERIMLTHIDSGVGFDENLLREISGYNETVPPKTVGGTGIYNTCIRLKLICGESASIRFSNEKETGARIDLDFPYQPVLKESMAD